MRRPDGGTRPRNAAKAGKDTGLRTLIVLLFLPALLLPSACKRSAAAPQAVTNTVTVAFVGDVCFDWGLERLVAKGFDPFAQVRDIIRSADIALYNNEMTVGSRGLPEDKAAHFRCPPRVLSLVTNCGFDVGTTANNHALDYGTVSLLDTLSNLDLYGIKHTGAGRDLAEAVRPVYIETNGIRIAVVAFGYMNPSNLIATARKPGVAPLFPGVVTNAVAEARRHSDFVIAVMHWGREYTTDASNDQRAAAKALVRAGAGLVVGHHPHILQGVENVDGTTVFYSMGNFCFPQTDNTNLRDSLIGLAAVKKITVLSNTRTECSCRVVPVYRSAANYAPEIRTGEAGLAIVSEVAGYSSSLTNGKPAVRFVSNTPPFYSLE